MTTLAEIEIAADTLSVTEQQQLMLYLASRLHSQGEPLPQNPSIASGGIGDWMAEDEAAMRRIRPLAM